MLRKLFVVESRPGGFCGNDGDVGPWDAKLMADKTESFQLSGDIFNDAKWNGDSVSGFWVKLCIVERNARTVLVDCR